MQTISEKPVNADLELARACAAGDNRACEELYRTYHRKIYGTCLKFLKRAEDAEDLTQDVFIQIFRKISGFNGDAKLSTWIHRVTINHALMFLRRENRVSLGSLEASEEGEMLQISDGENPRRMRIEDRLWIEKAVDQLSPGYKKVFILHDLEGFEHEEVARILNCSVGTSKSQLHKARLKLRGLLGKITNPRVYSPRAEIFA